MVDSRWYDRIHKADSTAENEIDSMLEFADTFVNVEVPATVDAGEVLTEEEYRSVLDAIRKVP